MNFKELYSIREWAPLTNITDRIPESFRNGLFSFALNITCVDAVAEFLALGSDAGIVFWVNRRTDEVQKLKTGITTRITCLKIVDSVEYMVAAGDSSGQVSVFQIQKELPPDLNLVAPCTRSKPIERYTIRDLHSCCISCCEWSKNGMKLFSGDRQGVVVLTEFDYQTHLCKSAEILSESYEIVQLSVHQSYLLVSSLYRSIICKCNSATKEWQITQVGKKDRKQLMDCGGIFLKRYIKSPTIICGRPGLRFWIADIEGNVEKTLMFRDAVTLSPTWEIPILNPKTATMQHSAFGTNNSVDARNFRNLELYAATDSLVVTHDDTTLYILNLDSLRVEAVANGFRKILDFCVCEKEIFVLEGERSLLRLAPIPEKPNKTAKIIFNPLMPPPVPLMGTSTSRIFESAVEFEPEEAAVIKAEECFELPSIEKINLNIPIELAVESPRAEQSRRLEIFNQISEMDFDQSILHHSGLSESGRRKRRSRDNTAAQESKGIVEIGRVADSIYGDCEAGVQIPNIPNAIPRPHELTTKPTSMDISYCQLPANDPLPQVVNRKKDFSQHLPDLLSPTTMKEQIEQKAKTLAEEMNLPEVHLQPITAEELHQSQVLAAPPPSMPHVGTDTKSLEQLAKAYPQHPQVEDAGVQTTPRKKIYYIEDSGDYSSGQPVDDICHNLRVATVVEKFEDTPPVAPASVASPAAQSAASLRFVSTHPVNEDISSFLLDFRRAPDPMGRRKNTPPESAESNTSSEWEFLDN